MEEKYSRPQCCALPGGPAGREGIMDQRQYPQYPQQPGGPCPPYVQQPGMEYPPYPPYGGQGSAAPPYGGPVYGQGGGPVPPRAPQYVYQTPGSMPGVPGGKPPRRRRNRAPLVAVLLCLGLAATVFLAGEAFDAGARRRRAPASHARRGAQLYHRGSSRGRGRRALHGGDCQDRWPQRGMHQCI